MIPCGDMRQSFTDTHVKWFFGNFPMFANSFSVVYIHCIARGLGASFRYKCLASCGGSLRQHGLLVLKSNYLVTLCYSHCQILLCALNAMSYDSIAV